jgi:O-antigen ligase
MLGNFFIGLFMIRKILLVILIYLPFQLAINPSEGIDLASIRIIIPLVFFLWLVLGLMQKKIIIASRMETWLIISFIFLSGFSIFWAENTNWGLRKFLFLLTILPVYFISVDQISQYPRLAKKIINFLIVGASLISLVGIIQFSLQFIIGLDPTLRLWEKIIVPFLGISFAESVISHPSWLVNIGGKTLMRSIAFFPDPHMFAYYLNLILPWTIMLYIKPKNNRWLYAISILLILIALLLTFSRGAYLGLIAWIVVGIFYWLRIYIKKRVVLFSIILLSFIFAMAIFSNNPVSQRFISTFSSKDTSNQDRLDIWKESLGIIYRKPMGVGIGNYSIAIKPSAGYREPIYSHNLYLDIAAETGILNSLVFIGILFFSMLSFWRKSQVDKLYLAGILSLIGFFVHSFFETPLYSVHVLTLLLIMFSISSAYDKELFT